MLDAPVTEATDGPVVVGGYALFDVVAAGGMATVHMARQLGPVGSARTVAVKCLHAHFTSEPELITMFTDEVRLVERICHPNVVRVVDVVEADRRLFLVMEYVHGESLSRLLKTSVDLLESIPIPIVTAIAYDVLRGLHGAHETTGADGLLLDVVHRDVSPQNVIVGADGIARVLDFGVAKAAGRAQVTRQNQIKGKLAYMAPEQIRGTVDRRADVFAASVVLWEAVTGRRLHAGVRDVEIVTRVVRGALPRPSEWRRDLSAGLDAVIMRGLEVDPGARYPTARAMADALASACVRASNSEVAAWVGRLAADALRDRAQKLVAMETASALLVPLEA